MSQTAPGDVAGTSEGASFTIEEALQEIGFGNTQVLMFIFVGIGACTCDSLNACVQTILHLRVLTDLDHAAWAGDGMEAMLLSYLGPEVRL